MSLDVKDYMLTFLPMFGKLFLKFSFTSQSAKSAAHQRMPKGQQKVTKMSQKFTKGHQRVIKWSQKSNQNVNQTKSPKV